MFDRFSDRSRKVMGLAREQALQFNHDYIGTEHLLLGLLRCERGIPSAILVEHGVGLDAAREEVTEILDLPRVDRDAPRSDDLDIEGLMKEIFRLHERVTELEATVEELRKRLRKLEGG